jgi:hypothetical protein
MKLFISAPFKCIGFTVRSITHFAEIAHGLGSFDLKEVDMVRGFDPKGIFKTHVILVNYNTLFPQVEEQEEGAKDNKDIGI